MTTKRGLRWAGLSAGTLLALAVLFLCGVYGFSEVSFRKSWDIQPPAFDVPADAATIARGAHLARVRGCVDCHGEDLGGKIVVEAPPLGRWTASNLTRGGIAASYSAQDWARAVRHGVRPDGSPLLFMPSMEYFILSDEDLAAIVAYARSVPAVERELAALRMGPLPRFLYLRGEMPLVSAELIDHAAERPAAPPEGPSPEYGHYLAVGCEGCHGTGLGGGRVPGMPPSAPAAANLTPHESGLAAWTEEDFFRALREGLRPDGSVIDPFMPWQLTAQMTDTEIRALWAYLRTVEPRPFGSR